MSEEFFHTCAVLTHNADKIHSFPREEQSGATPLIVREAEQSPKIARQAFIAENVAVPEEDLIPIRFST